MPDLPSMNRLAFDSMVTKIPILLGISDAHAPSDIGNTSVQHRGSGTGKVLLGLGIDYPVAPDAPPPGVTLKYWMKSSYNSCTIKKGKKTGQHKSNKNVGQIWIEDENGQPISGYITKSIHGMLMTSFHSLLWTGQAPVQFHELGYEACVYIHNVLG